MQRFTESVNRRVKRPLAAAEQQAKLAMLGHALRDMLPNIFTGA
jgi:hypothetical protein